MSRFIRTAFAVIAPTIILALAVRAIAEPGIFSQDVIELSLTVQTPVTGYPVADQGFWKKYPVASAPTYRIVSGTAPGLEISPVDVAVSTDGSDGSDSGDGPKDGEVDGPDSGGGSDGKDGGGLDGPKDEQGEIDASEPDSGDGLDGPTDGKDGTDSGTTDGKDGSGGGPKDEPGEIDAADSDGSDGWLDGPDSGTDGNDLSGGDSNDEPGEMDAGEPDSGDGLDGPTDGKDGTDSGTTDGKDGSGGGPKDEPGEIDAADSDGSDGWLDGPDSDGSDGSPDQEVYRGVKVVGTPTAVGVYSFEIDEVSESGTRRLTLTINVVKDTASRDAVSYYTNLANDAGGYDTFYWAALRGYWLGIGLNDESLAGYNYYSCLGGYYYTYYIETQPQYAYYFYYVNQANAWYTYYASTSPNHAAYQYFYNYALATYYLYYYSGDTQSAAYFYNLYISYANSVL